MVKMLGIVLFLFYFQFKTCLSEIIATNKGYCVVNYIEKVTVEESYVHTYTEPQLQLCSHGYRYYNCMRDVTKSERRKKKVLKDVPRTRVDCCAGYNNVTVHKNVYHCEPICDPPCIQGHCTAPGICTCPQGYEHQDSHECVPSCRPECKNSRCTSPGHCECDSGYDKINSSYCMPHCSQKCINGACHKPEECLCNAGYAKSNSKFQCEPICDKPCVHSNCTGYNECTCWNNYRKLPSQSNVCSPICDFECLHGHCTAPNVCACNQGYNMKVGSVNICEPECNNCTNGFCIAPNKCTCNQNYTRNEEGQCQPICHDCSNGKCILPYECECFEGFDKNEDDKCVPFCSGCENGNCTEPNVCTCFEGYERSTNGECFPACNGGCFAGECIAPNNCSCQEYDRVEDNVCFPLQSNITNNSSENIVPQRFQLKFFNSSEIVFSSVYVKVKCSFNKEIDNTTSCAINNSSAFSIDCSTIKNQKNGFKLLCIWNEFSSEIRDLYEESLSSVAYIEQENSTFLEDEILDMTILLPAEIMAEEESCFMCPCDKGISALVPGTFNILFSPCHLNSLKSSGLQRDLLHFSVLAVLVAMAVIVTVAFVVVYFGRRIRHDYIVHSSEQQMDDISLPLNPDEP